MKDNFKSGRKQFSRNNGGGNGNFKRGDRNYGDRKPENKEKFNKFGDKPNFSPKSRYGAEKKNTRYESGNGRFSKPGIADKPYGDRFRGKSHNSETGGKYERKDKKFTPGSQYQKFKRDADRKPYVNKPERKEHFGSAENARRPYKTDKITENITPVSVDKEDSGMVYGRNAVIELLKSGKTIDKLFVQIGQREGSITMIFAEAVKKSIPVIEVERTRLDSMINNSAHQGVIALASEKEYCSIGDIMKIAEGRNEKPFILIADKIMDPHNLGAVIRTAECAGVHGIIIPKRHAAGVSPIVVKTSAGASIHMAIAKVANIAAAIEELKEKGVWVFASALDSNTDEPDGREIKDYDGADYNMPLALVVGNEGEGLSRTVLQKSDFLIKIPMLGKIESLNVSCASAVLMYEVSRQRKQK